MKSTNDSVIIGFDYLEDKDNAVLIVGKKRPAEPIKIINSFHGEEAKELWEKLTTKKGSDQ